MSQRNQPISDRKLRRLAEVKARKIARKAGFPQHPVLTTATTAAVPVVPPQQPEQQAAADAIPCPPTTTELQQPQPFSATAAAPPASPILMLGRRRTQPSQVSSPTSNAESETEPLPSEATHSTDPAASSEETPPATPEPGFPYPPFKEISSARLEANRRNAKASHGALTPETKAISAQNHTIHGLTRHQNGTFKLLSCEDPQVFEALKQTLLEEHAPSTPTESILVHRMAESDWLAQRAQRLQHIVLNPDTGEISDEKKFYLYMRYETTHTRAFHKCLNDLNRLRKDKAQAARGVEAQNVRQEAQRVASEKHEMKKDVHYWETLKKDAAACRELSALATQNCAARSQNPDFQAEYEAQLATRGLKVNFWEAASHAA